MICQSTVCVRGELRLALNARLRQSGWVHCQTTHTSETLPTPTLRIPRRARAPPYLCGRGVLAVVQRQRERTGARQALEGQPGASRPDVAHPDHRAPHAHQAAEHAGTQRAERSQRLVVVQPVYTV